MRRPGLTEGSGCASSWLIQLVDQAAWCRGDQLRADLDDMLLASHQSVSQPGCHDHHDQDSSLRAAIVTHILNHTNGVLKDIEGPGLDDTFQKPAVTVVNIRAVMNSMAATNLFDTSTQALVAIGVDPTCA